MTRKVLAFILPLLLLTGCGSTRNAANQQVSRMPMPGKNPSYNAYIRQYAPAALQSQRQFGIPASITMAQGLLESGAGGSALAQKSNNHFGIKCHNSWRGARTYHRDDNPRDCFRVYDDPLDSYLDHGQFLTGNRRYNRLFALDMTDYKGWAKGLQSAGYATDRGYANKLIKIIEDYQLYLLVDGNLERDYAYNRPEQPRRTVSQKPPMKYEKPASRETTPAGVREIYKSYGLLYVLAKKEDDLASIARDLDISEKKLTDYNDFPPGYPIEQGDIIYLQRKLRRADPPYYRHEVRVGESIHGIAQRYGIQLRSLYQMNKLDPAYIPQEGDILILR